MIDLLDGDLEKVDNILNVSTDVIDYFQFKSVIDLGITLGPSDMPFEKLMIFSWIREGLESGRKT